MKQKKKDIIDSLAIHKNDVGSAEIQVGLLSDKIEKLATHFKKFNINSVWFLDILAFIIVFPGVFKAAKIKQDFT